MENALNFINEQLEVLNIPYQFGEWKTEVVYPYFVGEITPSPSTTEDGATPSDFILTGFHRGENGYSNLETIRKQIEKHFHVITGLRAKTTSGSIVVTYENAFFIPSGEADLTKIQINLSVREWKGDI